MEYDLERGLEILERTPAVLRHTLAGVDDGWIHGRYGSGTFSPFDVVGHLIHGEREDWIPRARIILESGESRPFDPFDRFAMIEQNAGQSIDELLETFTELRAGNLVELRSWSLGPEELARTGTHPELGRVTLEELLATWTVHDLSHLAQISRALAYQVRDHVGAWREYLPILSRGT